MVSVPQRALQAHWSARTVYVSSNRKVTPMLEIIGTIVEAIADFFKAGIDLVSGSISGE